MLRREGVRRLLVRVAVVAGSVFYRCVVIHGRDLSEPLPEATSALPVEIRLLKATDAAALARHRVDLEPTRVAARLQRLADGQACVAAWLDDQIISSTWLAFDTAWLPQLHRRLSLSPNEVFIYDTYTIEPMRGRGLATIRALWTARYLRDAGYRYAIGHTARENRPAQGPPEKAGYRALGTAGYVRLGPWRRDFVHVAGRRRRWMRQDEPIDMTQDFSWAPSEQDPSAAP